MKIFCTLKLHKQLFHWISPKKRYMQNIHEKPSRFSCLWSVLHGFRAVFYLGDEFFSYGQAFRNVRINHIGPEFVN